VAILITQPWPPVGRWHVEFTASLALLTLTARAWDAWTMRVVLVQVASNLGGKSLEDVLGVDPWTKIVSYRFLSGRDTKGARHAKLLQYKVKFLILILLMAWTSACGTFS
jgi:hypothetical protein